MRCVESFRLLVIGQWQIKWGLDKKLNGWTESSFNLSKILIKPDSKSSSNKNIREDRKKKCKKNVNVICLPTKHQGVNKTRSEVSVHSIFCMFYFSFWRQLQIGLFCTYPGALGLVTGTVITSAALSVWLNRFIWTCDVLVAEATVTLLWAETEQTKTLK